MIEQEGMKVKIIQDGAGQTATAHPKFSELCLLPNGWTETLDRAQRRGFKIASPAKSRASAPTFSVARPARPAAVLPTPAAVLSDRARMVELIRMTPPGAEAVRDRAIADGASVSDFRQTLFDRAIEQTADFEWRRRGLERPQ